MKPGERLKRIREARNLGLREVARLAEHDISHGYLSQLENEAVPIEGLTMRTIQLLARIYRMQEWELVRVLFNPDGDTFLASYWDNRKALNAPPMFTD